MFDILWEVENLTAHKSSLPSIREASKATVTTFIQGHPDYDFEHEKKGTMTCLISTKNCHKTQLYKLIQIALCAMNRVKVIIKTTSWW